MSDSDDPMHRSVSSPPPDAVTLREADDVEADEGMMEIRLPIASTGDVRNEGDDPLTTSELRGMAEQIDTLTRGVFPEHGESDKIDFAGYSQFEKLGYWADAEVEREASADGEDLLVATARMPDPETLPAATGSYREALAILKEQGLRGIPITTSIGWSDDADAPGGNDLVEASIVGIGADTRASSEGGEQLVARAAVDAGADPDALIAAVRAAVTETDDTADPEDTHDMTDDDTDTETDEEQTADDGETSERAEAPEWAADLRDLLEDIHDAVREDDMDGDDEDDDDEDEEEEDEDDEQAADGPDEEQDADDSALEERLADLEAELESVRSGETDVETPDPEAEQDADDADEQRDSTDSDSDPADPPAWAT